MPGGPVIEVRTCSRCGHEETTWAEVTAKIEAWFLARRAHAILAGVDEEVPEAVKLRLIHERGSYYRKMLGLS